MSCYTGQFKGHTHTSERWSSRGSVCMRGAFACHNISAMAGERVGCNEAAFLMI